jgi:hypothetical protein
MTRSWCKIMPKTNVGQIKGNEGSYFYLYSLVDLAQGSFQRSFYVCIEQFFWENLFNSKSTMSYMKLN